MPLAIGDIVVVIGTDDDQLAATLAPWLTTVPLDFDLSLVDFSAELHPPRPENRSVPRSIPVVHHGTVVLARSTDLDEVRASLLRVLGALAAVVPDGHVRLTGTPLLRDGAVELAAPNMAADGSRALRRRGYQPLYSGSVIIDPAALTVSIAPPLGSREPQTVAPLHSWSSDLPDVQPRWPFGYEVAMTLPRSLAMSPAPTTSTELAALVSLMERLPPRSQSDPAS